jgi:hypothetical protein
MMKSHAFKSLMFSQEGQGSLGASMFVIKAQEQYKAVLFIRKSCVFLEVLGHKSLSELDLD